MLFQAIKFQNLTNGLKKMFFLFFSEVEKLLTERFQPPITFEAHVHNPGRIVLKQNSILLWKENQK